VPAAYPENFLESGFPDPSEWRCGVAGVTIVADNPADHAAFFRAFSGVSDLKSNSNGIAIKTPRGEIQVMDSTAYRQHFAVEPPDPTRGHGSLRYVSLCPTRLALMSALGRAVSCRPSTWAML